MIYYNGVRHKCDPNVSISQLYPKHGPTGGAGLGNYLFVWGSISEERQLNVKFETSLPKNIEYESWDTKLRGNDKKTRDCWQKPLCRKKLKMCQQRYRKCQLEEFSLSWSACGILCIHCVGGVEGGDGVVFRGWWWDWQIQFWFKAHVTLEVQSLWGVSGNYN